MTQHVAEHLAAAATAWLDSLDPDQRRLAAWPFPSDGERERWFYTPTDHGGLPLAAMTQRQQSLAFQVLAEGLSPAGFNTVVTVMGLENILDRNENFRQQMAGRDRTRSPELYYLRVFGVPGPGGAWSWRWGGHHISVNVLVIDGHVRSTTPCFFGADPADSPLLGPHFLRPLGAVEDLGRELVRSLNPQQLTTAVISPAPPMDVVSANRAQVRPGDGPMSLADVWRDPPSDAMKERLGALEARMASILGFGPEALEAVRLTLGPSGVEAAQLAPAQQEILRALLDTYLGRMPRDIATEEAAKYAGDGLSALSFAWAGGLEKGQPHYYRVSGPRILVEYDNTQNEVNHIHAVWRDPVNDFGADVLGAHLRTSHHH